MISLIEMSNVFQVMSHPKRLQILDFLDRSNGPQRVTEIIAATDHVPTYASIDLKRLTKAGILIREKRKTSVYYSISDDRVRFFIQQVRDLQISLGEQNASL
jgi:DNA-binding transcriptional ArsR family regulator